MNKQKGKAIASMVLGIISVSLAVLAGIIIFFLFDFGLVIGAISLICGIIAIVLGNISRPLGRGIAGFVLGIVGTSLSSCLMIIGLIIDYFF